MFKLLRRCTSIPYVGIVYKFNAIIITTLFCLSLGFSQGDPDYQGGFKIPLNQDGSKYFRILGWGQMWACYKERADPEISPFAISIRRARGLFYSQLNKKFLFVAHIGANNISNTTLEPVGKGDGSQVFLHGLWGEFTVIPNILHIGSGLHYWNGISRLNSQSTLNMLTLDNHRSSWTTLGLSDQYGRHLGIYLKGDWGNWSYRLSINDAIKKSLDAEQPVSGDYLVYRGRELLGKRAQLTSHGYVKYYLAERESSFLPYQVGSYLGSKRIISLGAGFFTHPNGVVRYQLESSEPTGSNVFHYAFDVFVDLPLNNHKKNAVTAYAVYMSTNFGEKYLLLNKSMDIGTGQIYYSHLGYLFPDFLKSSKVQTFISYSYKLFDAYNESINEFGIGANWYIQGHHAKITLEYKHNSFLELDQNESMTIQAMVYL